jgi:hypothetical protein
VVQRAIDFQVVRNVMANEGEMIVPAQCVDVSWAARDEVIHADHFVAQAQKSLAQM